MAASSCATPAPSSLPASWSKPNTRPTSTASASRSPTPYAPPSGHKSGRKDWLPSSWSASWLAAIVISLGRPARNRSLPVLTVTCQEAFLMKERLRSIVVRFRKLFPAQRRLLVACSLLASVFLLFIFASSKSVAPVHQHVPFAPYR